LLKAGFPLHPPSPDLAALVICQPLRQKSILQVLRDVDFAAFHWQRRLA
jgi:hypothetical protein